MPQTFADLARDQLGPDAVFDWAMPQKWFDEAIRRTDLSPNGHVVWLYDKQARIFGRPYGLTDQGRQIVEAMQHEVFIK